MRRASRGRLEIPVSRRELAGYAVPADVLWTGGCAALCGCDWDCDCEGGEFVCAALAVAGGVLMPFVSGAGDAMVVGVFGLDAGGGWS